MRMVGLVAASVLVAGCSPGGDEAAERIKPVPSTSMPTTSSQPSAAAPTSTKPAQPPQPGAPIGDVIAWIEAGNPADAGGYHSATRDGQTTELGEDVAFRSGTTNCMTDSRNADGALACLVDLTNPPPQPADVYGEWKGGWVDFAGPTWKSARHTVIRAGSPPALVRSWPTGDALAFGDYRCRATRPGCSA